MGRKRLLPQGPVCLRAPDFSAPQPPEFGAGRAQPAGRQRRTDTAQVAWEFFVRFNTNDFPAGLRRPLFFVPESLGEATDRDDSPYRIAASEAPRIVFGLSAVPLCIRTTASSIPPPATACSGTLHELALPVQSPSLTQRRTTLW